MSYWVYLLDGNESVSVERHQEGGTYALGGVTEAELNVTYNYTKCYVAAGGESPRAMLDGKKASDTIPILRHLVGKLGTKRDADYWAATPGNAGYAMSILLHWAEQHPDAVWSVS